MSMKSPIQSFRSLGQTDCKIPVFGFGAAHLGELYTTVSDKDSRETIEAAWEGGVRYFDTAPWYGHGLSEHRLGEVLRTKPRNNFVVSTKVGRVYHKPCNPGIFSTAPWTGGLPFEHRFDYTYDGVMRSYEDSLQRLSLNRIDILVIHDLDREYHKDPAVFNRHWADLTSGGIRALHELKKAGDVQAIGAGVNVVDMLAPMATQLDLDFCLVAMPYTLLEQSALTEGFQACEANSVSVIIGSPFASGLLATGIVEDAKYNYAEADRRILEKTMAIVRVCEEFRVALPAAALQFVLAHPLVASVIPGAASRDQINQNLVHLNAEIPSDFWTKLRDLNLLDGRAPTP